MSNRKTATPIDTKPFHCFLPTPSRGAFRWRRGACNATRCVAGQGAEEKHSTRVNTNSAWKGSQQNCVALFQESNHSVRTFSNDCECFAAKARFHTSGSQAKADRSSGAILVRPLRLWSILRAILVWLSFFLGTESLLVKTGDLQREVKEENSWGVCWGLRFWVLP